MILYFSGTGNSRYAAEYIAKRLGETDVRELDPSTLRDPSSAVISGGEGDQRVIWVFPTYSWGIPPVVAEVMKHATFNSVCRAATHFMLTTCGDDMAYTDRQWRKIMHARKVSTGGAYAVQMPNTYVCMKGFDIDPVELAAKKIEEAAPRLDAIAASIENNGPDLPVRLPWSWAKSKIVYPWFVRFAMSPRPFKSNEGCTGCGACSRLCPMDNISMHEGKPKWGDKCALCLRCYHSCPRHAIAYGKASDGKGQYLFPRKQ